MTNAPMVTATLDMMSWVALAVRATVFVAAAFRPCNAAETGQHSAAVICRSV
jgi:hypothetical protein